MTNEEIDKIVEDAAFIKHPFFVFLNTMKIDKSWLNRRQIVKAGRRLWKGIYFYKTDHIDVKESYCPDGYVLTQNVKVKYDCEHNDNGTPSPDCPICGASARYIRPDEL